MASIVRAAKELLPQVVSQEGRFSRALVGAANARPWSEGNSLGFRRTFMQEGTLPSQSEAAQGGSSPSAMQERVETVKETVKGLGDIGREVVKSVQRDTGSMAEKVKEQASAAVDTAQQIGEVGKLAAKSVQRDATILGAKAMEQAGVSSENAEKLKEMGHQVGKSMAEDANIAANKTSEAAEKATNTSREVKDHGMDMGGSVQENVKKAADAVGEQVEKGKNTAEELTSKVREGTPQTPEELVELGVQTGDSLWKKTKGTTEAAWSAKSSSNQN